MKDPNNTRKETSEATPNPAGTGTIERRKPYDTSDVDWAPQLDDDDPPYRDWWVVEQDNA